MEKANEINVDASGLTYFRTNNPEVVRLDCSDNQLTEIDLNYFPKLTRLFMKNNKITDETLKFLDGNETIEVLNISGNPVTNFDIFMPNLKTLSICCNNPVKICTKKLPSLVKLFVNYDVTFDFPIGHYVQVFVRGLTKDNISEFYRIKKLNPNGITVVVYKDKSPLRCNNFFLNHRNLH